LEAARLCRSPFLGVGDGYRDQGGSDLRPHRVPDRLHLRDCRVLLVAPHFGETLAVSLEAPVMLIASWFVSRWCLDWLDVPRTVEARSLNGRGRLRGVDLGGSLPRGARLRAIHDRAPCVLASVAGRLALPDRSYSLRFRSCSFGEDRVSLHGRATSSTTPRADPMVLHRY